MRSNLLHLEPALEFSVPENRMLRSSPNRAVHFSLQESLGATEFRAGPFLLLIRLFDLLLHSSALELVRALRHWTIQGTI
jgi:hypothetical protein